MNGNFNSSAKRYRRFIDAREAPVFSRVKSFIIDVIIIFFTMTIISGILWKPLQSFIWGKQYLTREEYAESGSKNSMEAQNLSGYDRITFAYGEPRHYRRTGFVESFISFNINYPLLPIILYFGLMWRFFGASAGQLLSKTTVVTLDDDPPDLLTALKRSVIFVFSVSFFGLGALTLFGEDNLTIYDRLCDTKVIEK